MIRENETFQYPLAPNPVFLTVQGEGGMLGVPMVFVRLAGCSVGCSGCDTDYSKKGSASAGEIASRVADAVTESTRWVWITGGEPTDHDLAPLLASIRRVGGLKIALATSGCRPVTSDPEFLSVSPHSISRFVQRSGDEVKVVFGLNGMSPSEELDGACAMFHSKFVAPMMSRIGTAEAAAVKQCRDWVTVHPEWKMTCQAHKQWGVS